MSLNIHISGMHRVHSIAGTRFYLTLKAYKVILENFPRVSMLWDTHLWKFFLEFICCTGIVRTLFCSGLWKAVIDFFLGKLFLLKTFRLESGQDNLSRNNDVCLTRYLEFFAKIIGTPYSQMLVICRVIQWLVWLRYLLNTKNLEKTCI